MALAFDAASAAYFPSASTTQTLSHTCTGSNLILVVGVHEYGGTVSGVTYNGVAMTASQTGSTGGDTMRSFYLINPATGAHNIVATLTSNRLDMCGLSLTGAKQTGQPDATTSGTGNDSTAQANVTTVADNSWGVLFASMNGSSGAFSNGTSCTVGASVNDRSGIGYGGPKTPAGSFVQNMGLGGAGNWGTIQVSVAPAPVVVTGSPSVLLMGA